MGFALDINQNIIQDFSQLKDVFPEVLEAADGSYLLMFTFGEAENCLLRMARAGRGQVAVQVFGSGSEAVSANLLKWFFWIFARD